MKTEIAYYDASGNQVKDPQEATRAEITTYDNMGQRVRVEYYNVDSQRSYTGKPHSQPNPF